MEPRRSFGVFHSRGQEAYCDARGIMEEKRMKPIFAALLAAAAAATLAASPARADSIDGHWCADDGRYLNIRGPVLVTPGGRQIDGAYTRHGFSYVVPDSEPGGGATSVLTLVSDRMVHRTVGAAGGAPEIWRRCAPATS